MTAFVRAEAVDFVVIGPEQPLAAGVSDALRDVGSRSSGPRRLPRGSRPARRSPRRSWNGTACPPPGRGSARRRGGRGRRPAFGAPVVVKADGLAAGKGVTVAATIGRGARGASMPRCGTVPSARRVHVVVEECLVGPEVSFFVLCDGAHSAGVGAGPQARLRQRRGRIPAAWARSRPARLVDGRARRPRSCGPSSIRCSPACGPRATRLRHPLLRPDAHRRRPQGDRVQREVRRSRGAGRLPLLGIRADRYLASLWSGRPVSRTLSGR